VGVRSKLLLSFCGRLKRVCRCRCRCRCLGLSLFDGLVDLFLGKRVGAVEVGVRLGVSALDRRNIFT